MSKYIPACGTDLFMHDILSKVVQIYVIHDNTDLTNFLLSASISND